MLFIADDLNKKQWRPEQWEKIRCALRRYRGAVEANGATRFIALIAPDKSSVYARYLPAEFHVPHACSVLSADPTLALVCPENALTSAVSSGIEDVYLPNDTHWASVAARLVARTVADHAARNPALAD